MKNPIIPAASPAVFQFNNSQIRTITKDGEPWFVAADVCSVLGIANNRNATARLDDDEKDVRLMDTPGGKQETTIVNESGLYSLILRSDKPEAKRFKKWVTSEVLPAIRKTGGYHLPQTMPEALRQLASEIEYKNANQHKVDFYNAVASTSDLILMRDVAKILAVPHLGQNIIYKHLRFAGVLQEDNTPYQRYVDKGYFMIRVGTHTRNGEQHIHKTTMVTQKGLDFLRRFVVKNMEGGLYKYAPIHWKCPDAAADTEQKQLDC